MLVKINEINTLEHKVRVTQLDIDNYGSIVPLRELELDLPTDDNSIIQILKNSSHAAIFTEKDVNDDTRNVIILANGMTTDDLNREKDKIIRAVAEKKL
jgi:hypothetical protein